MGFLSDLYAKCLGSHELLKMVPKLLEAKNDPDLATIARLGQLPYITSENRQLLEKRRIRCSGNALKRWLSQGTYIIGVGFRSIDDLEPCIIPSHEWYSLAIDYQNSRAFCTGREYTGVRFLNTDMFEGLSECQIGFIEGAAKGEPQAAPVELGVAEQQTEVAGITKERELHHFVWRVRLYLIEQKKPVTWRCVWREMEKNYKNYDQDDIIENIEHGEIHWCSSGNTEQRYKKKAYPQ